MTFQHDERLGIDLPCFPVPYEELSPAEQEDILVTWEAIRARIPDQIMFFEHVIESILDRVHHEEDWDIISAHFGDIADYASRIHELNTWRRVDPSLPHGTSHSVAEEHRAREK